MRLEGRIAIVTGAGSGIGRASAVLFAKEGAFVALVDRDRAGLQETLAVVEDFKGEASLHVGDVGHGLFDEWDQLAHGSALEARHHLLRAEENGGVVTMRRDL